MEESSASEPSLITRRENELNFLVSFNFILSALKRYKVCQGLLKDVQGFLDLVVTILNSEKEINCLFY